MGEIQVAIENLGAKGWTVAAIADAMGVGWQTVYRWKRGMNAPPGVATLRLLRALEGRKEAPKRRRIK